MFYVILLLHYLELFTVFLIINKIYITFNNHIIKKGTSLQILNDYNVNI